MPKFEKCKGKGDARDHVREFYIIYEKVSYSNIYLKRNFPKSLRGDALTWFFYLPHGSIKLFLDLIKIFVSHCSYNIENDASMMDL